MEPSLRKDLPEKGWNHYRHNNPVKGKKQTYRITGLNDLKVVDLASNSFNESQSLNGETPHFQVAQFVLCLVSKGDGIHYAVCQPLIGDRVRGSVLAYRFYSSILLAYFLSLRGDWDPK